MKYICTLITVKDIKKAKYFYENILGQKVKADFGENVTFEGDFAIHQIDHFKKLINDSPIIKKSNSFELYFEENNLEFILNKLKQNNIKFVHEIIEQPWKQRVIRFYDFDENIIEVGEKLEYTAFRLSKENYSIDEICKITYLPEEIVKKSIKEYSK